MRPMRTEAGAPAGSQPIPDVAFSLDSYDEHLTSRTFAAESSIDATDPKGKRSVSQCTEPTVVSDDAMQAEESKTRPAHITKSTDLPPLIEPIESDTMDIESPSLAPPKESPRANVTLWEGETGFVIPEKEDLTWQPFVKHQRISRSPFGSSSAVRPRRRAGGLREIDQLALIKIWAKRTDFDIDATKSPAFNFAGLARARGWVEGDVDWQLHWDDCFPEPLSSPRSAEISSEEMEHDDALDPDSILPQSPYAMSDGKRLHHNATSPRSDSVVIWNCLVAYCGRHLDTYDAALQHMEEHHDVSKAQFVPTKSPQLPPRMTYAPFRWTKISRRLVNPTALSQAKESFEASSDYVLVHRVLTEQDIHELAAKTLDDRSELSSTASDIWYETCMIKKPYRTQQSRANNRASTETQLELSQTQSSLSYTPLDFIEETEVDMSSTMSLGGSSIGTPTQPLFDPSDMGDTEDWPNARDGNRNTNPEVVDDQGKERQEITDHQTGTIRDTDHGGIELCGNTTRSPHAPCTTADYLPGVEVTDRIGLRMESPPTFGPFVNVHASVEDRDKSDNKNGAVPNSDGCTTQTSADSRRFYQTGLWQNQITCDYCRRHKLRCDRKLPVCAGCLRWGKSCIYSEAVSKKPEWPAIEDLKPPVTSSRLDVGADPLLVRDALASHDDAASVDGNEREYQTGVTNSPDAEPVDSTPGLTESHNKLKQEGDLEGRSAMHDDYDRQNEAGNSKVCECTTQERHLLPELSETLTSHVASVQGRLPEEWQWDMQYQPSSGSWTCTPEEMDEPVCFPLTVAGAPVVLPVEHQWPPIGGVNPPPDPRLSGPIDCRAHLSVDVIRDIFVTFEGSIGFYLLINGLLQVIVPSDFDTTWASSHLPHKFGGLKVSYIEQSLEPTMMPSKTATTKIKPSLTPQNTGTSSLFRLSQPSTTTTAPNLQLNDFIEARGKSTHREKYTGRIGLNVAKDGAQYLIMSSHVIAEAILAKSFFGRGRAHTERLQEDWNSHADIWAGNEKVLKSTTVLCCSWLILLQIGMIEKNFDVEAEIYPNGFQHDVALIKPTNPISIQSVKSPIDGLGWLSRDAWSTLRQQTSALKILDAVGISRDAKTLKCSLCSDVLVVGKGIFLNQMAAAGAKSLKDHDRSTWTNLVSRAVLYRVNPDFDHPNGFSGIALYAEGMRSDSTEGPGVVGFQSFVQRSGQVQNYSMEGSALEQRLKKGRIAFYGAFQVPDELRKEYTIV